MGAPEHADNKSLAQGADGALVDTELPRVLLRHLRSVAEPGADPPCGRRLRRERLDPRGANPNAGANAKYAVDTHLLEAARVAHSEHRSARASDFPRPTHLTAEQQQVYLVAAAAYVALFGDTPGRVLDHDPWSSDFDELGATVVAPLGLVLRTEAGTEVRSLRLTRRPVSDLELRVLRLRVVAAGLAPARYVAVDLLSGDFTAHDLALGHEADDESWLRARVALLTEIAEAGRALVGPDCRDCRFVAGCPSMQGDAPPPGSTGASSRASSGGSSGSTAPLKAASPAPSSTTESPR